MPPRKKSSNDEEEYDPATRFLFVPHTVTFLAIGKHYDQVHFQYRITSPPPTKPNVDISPPISRSRCPRLL